MGPAFNFYSHSTVLDCDLDSLDVVRLLAGTHDQLGGVALEGSLFGLNCSALVSAYHPFSRINNCLFIMFPSKTNLH